MTNHQPKFKQRMFRENPEEMTKVHLLSKALCKVKMGKKEFGQKEGEYFLTMESWHILYHDLNLY